MNATAVTPLTTADAETLIAAARTAVLISGETSTRKAYTALQLNASTAGVPIHRDGRVIGAIGLGGGAPEQDHSFATAALEALTR
ncbi:heme-binding protein [Nonomuraea spiralis]|uniref:Heme-binding protein n=1 Tax=Nonomuraea spiralis TaxID=46182 RepID=A0ABV5IVY3_9ACTN|nr:heme-binding protein [Nonomuraea spiralis]GGS84620.1 hypothetical protein GCM10010176_030430 [Nonomuraea spiralis]